MKLFCVKSETEKILEVVFANIKLNFIENNLTMPFDNKTQYWYTSINGDKIYIYSHLNLEFNGDVITDLVSRSLKRKIFNYFKHKYSEKIIHNKENNLHTKDLEFVEHYKQKHSDEF